MVSAVTSVHARCPSTLSSTADAIRTAAIVATYAMISVVLNAAFVSSTPRLRAGVDVAWTRSSPTRADAIDNPFPRFGHDLFSFRSGVNQAHFSAARPAVNEAAQESNPP